MISGTTRRRHAQQGAHRLGDVPRLDHLVGGDALLDEVGHRRVHEAGAERRVLDPFGTELAVHRLGEAHDGVLGRGVDRQPRLAGLAGDRRGVDHQRVAVLGAGGAQHLGALAVEEDDRADVEVELHVEALGLRVGDRGADARRPRC